jgi:hypothetical protein
MLAGGEMIRKIILPIALFSVLSLLAGCGGGAGTSSEPVGVNKSLPSIIQLLPVQQIVQTNSNIYLKAKVLDGNGNVAPNVPVTFTNLSLLGVLSSTHAMTDSLGFATVTLFSTDSGFATVQAEVNTETGKVRDKKTVFFSIFDLTVGAALPTLTLAVDNNNDGSFNDPTDFNFFDPADPHDDAIVRATVKDENGTPVVGDSVTFTADSIEATFPDSATPDKEDVKTTNLDGQAFTRLKVVPTELRNFTVPLNVLATSSATGAFNVITLFIGPITVDEVDVSANPKAVASGETTTITANVTTAAGTPVPDGTSVNFTFTTSPSVSGGGIPPFAQTTDGIATADFDAPKLAAGAANITAKITASVGGKSGFVNVPVTAPTAAPGPLVVTPPNIPVVSPPTTPKTVTFTISGGTGPYFTSSSDPFRAFNGTSGNGTWNTSTITVTIPVNACPGTITLTTSDATGATKTATITIVTASPLAIAPPSAIIRENIAAGGVGTTADFTVSGGTPPYTATSSSIGVIPNPTVPGTAPYTFTVDATDNSITTDTIVTITVTDACNTSKTASVQVLNQ